MAPNAPLIGPVGSVAPPVDTLLVDERAEALLAVEEEWVTSESEPVCVSTDPDEVDVPVIVVTGGEVMGAVSDEAGSTDVEESSGVEESVATAVAEEEVEVAAVPKPGK